MVMGDIAKAHCTHEPHAVSLMAGANLFFPEVGSSPRDGQADTGKGRGRSINQCQHAATGDGLGPGSALQLLFSLQTSADIAEP